MSKLVVFVSVNSPDHLRGYLDRYGIEIAPGVWISTMSSKLRNKIWDTLVEHDGKALLVYADSTSPTGYLLQTSEPYTRIVLYDEIPLIGKISQDNSADKTPRHEVSSPRKRG